MPTKTYEIFRNKEVVVPWNWSKNAVSIAKDITWDEKNTTISSVKLRTTIKPSEGYTKAWIELNYTEVGFMSWVLGDNSLKSSEVDIIGSIVNGSNFFNIVVAKEFANFNEVKFVLSQQVVISYEGKEPVEKPSLQKYLEYAVAGIGVTAAVITVTGAIKGEDKE